MTASRGLLVALLLSAGFVSLATVRRDLPWAPDSDEIDFLVRATQMASSGDPNPRWFGHPGTTFLYPYALGLHATNAARGLGPWLRADPGLPEDLQLDLGAAILAGRLVSVAYAVLGLWMVCLVGDRAFGEPVGLVGGWFALLSPLTLDHVTLARTDGAGLFFGFLALLALLRLWQAPSLVNQVLAGLTLGFGIATRYFLAGIAPLLLLVEIDLLRRSRPLGWRPVLTGLACVPLGLTLASPFLLLELPSVWSDLAHETRASHPGADGLGFLGNLEWYLREALPRSIAMPLLILAGVGTVRSLLRRDVPALLLLGFFTIFVVGISFATLHWGRWLIQVLPIPCLFAASALVWIVRSVCTRWELGPDARRLALVAAVLAVGAVPAAAFVRHARVQTMPSTREQAREWIVTHLPPGTRIAADLYTAPLQETPFAETDYVFSLAQAFPTPASLHQRGYDVAMVSSAVYRRFFAEPGRYGKEIAFYESLFRDHSRIAEFRAAPDGRGPVIRLYRLDGTGG